MPDRSRMRSVRKAVLIASSVVLSSAAVGGCGDSDNAPITAPPESGVSDLAKKRAERGKAGTPPSTSAPAKP